MSHSNSQEVMQELEKMSQQLAARKCSYMAAVLLQYYDGEFALETKEARLKLAQMYRDIAREEAAVREASAKAHSKSAGK